MTHLSITGGAASWGDHVTDEYHRPEPEWPSFAALASTPIGTA
jgi:hypothetical protein